MKRASREDVEVLRRLGKVEKDRITRDILVPADITLHALSYAIQRSFGWQNSHLHCFKYPAAVFQEMTGGKEEPRDDVYAKYDGLVTESRRELSAMRMLYLSLISSARGRKKRIRSCR